uniref:peptidylprolyl isomerase n=1 Tax=Pinguiococcus pyrenoidosus TaxID=172671 RepID=A0A6U0VPV4_9STRA|mmetsp:Transcript_4438/g.17461  ORF Transcript_4438/g.17461 Transcript_4438/m.17461 type:complete len:346 (+) Transcript_4438:103-1140(+)
MGFFGVTVAPGQPETVEIVAPERVLRISSIAVRSPMMNSVDHARVQIRVRSSDPASRAFTLCTLAPTLGSGAAQQWCTELLLAQEDSPVAFSVEGGGEVDVTGFWEDVDEAESDGAQVAQPVGNDRGARAVAAAANGVAKGAGSDGKKRAREAKATEAKAEAERDEKQLTPEEEARQAKRAAKKARRQEQEQERRALAAAFAAAEKEDAKRREEAEAAAGTGRRVVKPKDRTLPGKLRIMDRVIGNGNPLRKGKQVRLVYEGFLGKEDGRMFDSNMNRGRPFKFRLGTREVIEGMDRGVEGMREGGIRRITVPPALGYGAKGTSDGSIPPNSTLVFVVEIVGTQT